MDIFEELYGMPQKDVTIDKQLSDLADLEITCTSEEQLKEVNRWKEQEEYSFVEEAGNTYVTILEMIGSEEPYSTKVYSFDSEAEDEETMYSDFLNHILVLAQDEFKLADLDETIDEEEETHAVSFQYNGHAYHFEAEDQGDWMDCEIIDFMNQVFEKEGNPKRLLCMANNSQGFIVMYNTIAWARAFAQKTSRPLSTIYELSELILPE